MAYLLNFVGRTRPTSSKITDYMVVEFNIPHNPTTNIQKMNASKPGERYQSFTEKRKIDLIFKESPFELEQDLKSLLMPGIYTCG